MFCPRCGMQISEKSVFCHSCGVRLDEVLRQQAVPAPSDNGASGSVGPENTQPPFAEARNTAAAAKHRVFPVIMIIAAVAAVLAAVIIPLIVLRTENVTDMEYSLPCGDRTIAGRYTGTVQLGKPQGTGKFSFTDTYTYHNQLFNFDTVTRNDYIYEGEFRDGGFEGSGTVIVDVYNKYGHIEHFEFDGEFRDLMPYDCTFVMTTPEDSPNVFDKAVSDENYAWKGSYEKGKIELDINDIGFVNFAANIAKYIPIASGFVDTALDGISDWIEESDPFASYGIFKF